MLAYSYEQWHSRRYLEARERERQPSASGASGKTRPLDERLLLAGGLATYRDHDRLGEDAALLRTYGYRLYVIDGSRFLTSGAFHGKVRLMLDHVGRYDESLAGFAGALRELPLSSTGRAAIVFHHFDVFARQCRTLASEVLAAIESESRSHLRYKRRLVTLLSCSTLGFDALGTPSRLVHGPEAAPPSSGVREAPFMWRRVDDTLQDEDSVIDVVA